jgi:S1-C subfamily serine protease
MVCSAAEKKALLSDGAKRRYALGWTMLRDKGIGLQIGVPTKLVRFVGARSSNANLEYKFEGDVEYTLAVRYGDYHCGTMNSYYSNLYRIYRPSYAIRRNDWFALSNAANGKAYYAKAICSASAVAFAKVGVSGMEAGTQDILFAALADSFALGDQFNPTATPRPKLDAALPRPEDYKDGDTKVAHTVVPLPSNVDGLGKTGSGRVSPRPTSELRAEQVFVQAGAAVYVLKAPPRFGSAVAISENELLTNCHVVADLVRVTLLRDHKELPARVVSKNMDADRCVLRTDEKLAAWVRVRSFESVAVGERAYSLGTPSGLELTLAEGVVSSKRTPDDRRYIQTSAPISPGSSGGGLFDAQGNLLGITTFHVVGAQNLNFAIAAEEYVK